MNLRVTMYVKNTQYSWRKKNHKNTNKATKTTTAAIIYLGIFSLINGFITSCEIKMSVTFY